MIPYPAIDPIIFSVGPLAVRWYGLMYVIGFAAAWWLARRRAARPDSTWQPADVDDLIFYAAIGVILGGRLGWIAFYGGEQVVQDPLTIIRIWEGGMSFHGGLIGVLIAVLVFARQRERRVPDVVDPPVELAHHAVVALRPALRPVRAAFNRLAASERVSQRSFPSGFSGSSTCGTARLSIKPSEAAKLSAAVSVPSSRLTVAGAFPRATRYSRQRVLVIWATVFSPQNGSKAAIA